MRKLIGIIMIMIGMITIAVPFIGLFIFGWKMIGFVLIVLISIGWLIVGIEFLMPYKD